MALEWKSSAIPPDLAARLRRQPAGRTVVRNTTTTVSNTITAAPVITPVFEMLESSVLIADQSGSAVSGAWNVYDASGLIPEDARFVYLAFSANAIESGETVDFYVRSASGAHEYHPLHIIAIEGADDVASNDNWVLIPVSAQSFDWRVDFTGTPSWSIKLLGYQM